MRIRAPISGMKTSHHSKQYIIATAKLPQNNLNTAFTHQMSTWGLHRFIQQQLTFRTDELHVDFSSINF